MQKLQVFKARQLYFENYAIRPLGVDLELPLETGVTVARATPLFAHTLPGHSAYWGHAMYPFSSPKYSTQPLNIWSGKNIVMCGKKGGLLFADGTYDRSAFDFFNWDSSSLSPKIVGREVLCYDTSHTEKIYDTVFLGFNGGHTNYAHWFTDHLVLLDIYVEFFQRNGVKIVLPTNMTSFAKESVSLLGISPQDIIWAGDHPLHFLDLKFLSPFSFSEIPKRYNQSVDRLLAHFKYEASTQNQNKRVFISRGDATSRPFVNEKRLENMMRNLGYDVVVTGAMTLSQQINYFREVDVVVGAHGAGLINAIFCKPGATLVEVFPEYMMQPHFWTTASLRALNYGYVAGTSLDPDSAISTPASAWHSASVAPLAQLRLALSNL